MLGGLQMSDQDFRAHNDEARRVWDAYEAGTPIRTPMMLGMSPRIYLSDPTLNTHAITYERYHTDAETMIDVQVRFQDYWRHNLYADHEMGLPDVWTFYVDGGNFSHSAWYGCEVFYSNADSPDTRPILSDDNKNLLFDRGLPEPFSGSNGRFRDLYEQMSRKLAGFTYRGVPADPRVAVPQANTMGNGIPFTTACKLRGTGNMCADMVLDPDFARQLLTFITDAMIQAIKTWRRHLGLPIKTDNVMLGDDSIILLSPEMYREFVLPLHRRIYEEFGTPGAKRGIHLCGNAARHLSVLRHELHVDVFDTGFPLDHAALYQDLGEGARVQGGVKVELLRSGTPEQVREETIRILSAVKPFRRFVLRDANNLAPRTPPANCRAMYEACREYGAYS